MRTVREVADLTGISVRTLQYYDEIGLLQPTKVNDVGYRFYDEAALQKLQQILFFKELDFPLKEIKGIIDVGTYDNREIFGKQRKLLTAKRDRLNRLLGLLERLEKGETVMSFKEFDMSEYIEALEKFKVTRTDQVIKHWGSVDKFDEFIQRVRENEPHAAEIAIKQFESIEKYTKAMKYNLEHFEEIMERVDENKENADEVIKKNEELFSKLTADTTKDAKSKEIQGIVKEIVELSDKVTREFGMDMGEGYWNMIIEGYADPKTKEIMDKKYGEGASEYIAKAFRCFFFV